MDMVEDLEKVEVDGDSVSGEALPLGLMLAWEEEDYLLRNQAEAIKEQLEQIDARTRDLESEK